MCQLINYFYEARFGTVEFDLKQAVKTGMDAFALNCTALQKLAEQRRNSMRPAINPQYRVICAKQDAECHEFLFCPNLTQKVEDIKETPRVGTTFARGSSGPKNAGRFLGRGNTFQRKRPLPQRQTKTTVAKQSYSIQPTDQSLRERQTIEPVLSPSQVGNCDDYVAGTIEAICFAIMHLQAGQLKFHLPYWETLTSDRQLLSSERSALGVHEGI